MRDSVCAIDDTKDPTTVSALSKPTLASSIYIHLMLNSPTPRRARNLHRTPNRKSNPTVSKQRRTRPGINTKIKVQIRPILIRPPQAVLRTQRVPLRWTQVGDLNHNRVPSVTERLAAAVGVGGQFPTRSAAWAGACAWADTEDVLRYGGAVAGVGVEAAGCGCGVAVAAAPCVGAAVPGGGLVVSGFLVVGWIEGLTGWAYCVKEAL